MSFLRIVGLSREESTPTISFFSRTFTVSSPKTAWNRLKIGQRKSPETLRGTSSYVGVIRLASDTQPFIVAKSYNVYCQQDCRDPVHNAVPQLPAVFFPQADHPCDQK